MLIMFHWQVAEDIDDTGHVPRHSSVFVSHVWAMDIGTFSFG